MGSGRSLSGRCATGTGRRAPAAPRAAAGGPAPGQGVGARRCASWPSVGEARMMPTSSATVVVPSRKRSTCSAGRAVEQVGEEPRPVDPAGGERLQLHARPSTGGGRGRAGAGGAAPGRPARRSTTRSATAAAVAEHRRERVPGRAARGAARGAHAQPPRPRGAGEGAVGHGDGAGLHVLGPDARVDPEQVEVGAQRPVVAGVVEPGRRELGVLGERAPVRQRQQVPERQARRPAGRCGSP